ncbi:hypothetical protein [Amycolatopsis cihanbeyliensis]|uniref:PE family protein n=1 Tax=Amycolatopsis cihanbeyliensis TaxID=1128664 RepID=A0A542CV10_AMYCI|nr:hypothetical protein [Amycolatopsis cihanbeyliensis]TQI94650.1 hypothetical protein FB471_6822 [Amycolatopsis cihanbeyliensis]
MWVEGQAGDQRSGLHDIVRGAAAPVQAAQQAGSFAYDEPTMREIIKEWNGLIKDCEDGLDGSAPMSAVQGPGLDPASTGMAAKANDSGHDYQRMLGEMREYALAQIELCEKALGVHTANEDENESWLGRLVDRIESEQQGGGTI